MKITLDMPPVATCSVRQCAYNLENACHAKAITVGDGIEAECDTFFTAADHTKTVKIRAGVGACKVTSCKHNSDLECAAPGIEVGMKEDAADCLTFEPRH